jgi:hypothetical protein
MKRRHWHASVCRNVDKPGDHSGGISATGLCHDCGLAALRENVAQMEARSGPNFTKWRHGMIRCAGGLVLDDLRDPA